MRRHRKMLNKNEKIQLLATVFAFVLIVILPLINYIYFKTSIIEGIDIGDLEIRYDSIIIILLIIGVITTLFTYLIFNYPKYSIKRAAITLTQSLLDVAFVFTFSLIGSFFISFGKFRLLFDISRVYLLIIIALIPFVIKNTLDIIDFKKNRNYYQMIERRKEIRLKKSANALIKCKKCDYMCRIGWKKCPICKTKLK